MKDNEKTLGQLVNDLSELRSQNVELEKSVTGYISAQLVAEELHHYTENIVETVREPLLVLNADLKIISANHNFYRTFQVTPGETIGSFIYDLGNKQWDIPRLRELLEEVLPEKQAFDNFEVVHNFQDIGHKIMLLNARQIYRKEIGAKMILLAIEDITEHKRLEDLLTESEERYRRLFETASDGIVLLEKSEGKIIHANPATEKMLGYASREIIGNNLQGIGVSLDMSDFQTTMQNLNKCGMLNYNDVQIITKSGQHIDVDIYLVNRAKLIQCNIRDITERKQVGREIKLNESRLKMLVDILQHPSDTIQNFLDYALEQAIQLTGSKIGYIYHYQEDSKEFVLNTWSKEVMVECTVAKPLTCYELDKTGIWGEAVRQRRSIIVNDFTTHPLKKGYPEGHVQLLKFMTIPIFKGEGIVGVVGLANKETDYDETDILQVSLLMEAVWKVTERKRAEVALRESNELFSLYMRHSPIYTYIKEVTPIRSIVLQASDNFGQMIGISGSEMIGKTMMELFPPELAAKITADDAAVVSRGDVLRLDEELNGRSYTTIKFPIARGDKTLLAGYTIDITDGKLAAEKLRQSEEKFSKAFQTSPYAITITRAEDGTFVEVNGAFTEMTGFTREEAIAGSSVGLKLWVNEEDRQHVVAALQAGQTVVSQEFQFRAKSGKVITGLFSAQTIHLSHGPCILSSINDITKRKRAEAEKVKLEIQLLQTHKMEAIGTLAGGIAHDFNNILAAMIGYTELSLAEDQKETRQHYLQEILKGAERARDLVKQILTFSRQDSSEKKPLDLKLLLKEAFKFLRASIPATIEIREHSTNESCNILADHTQVYQVIMNLCTNASHAMKQTGGTLMIELSTMKMGKGEILHHPGLKPGPYVKLSISDTGCGIDSAIIQRIFDPFFTTKSKDEGTGLGLSVAYGIIKSHNGVINVYSELGKGSSFSVYLPRITHDAVTIGSISETVIGGTEQILFVDDEPAMVDIGRLTLSSLGYKVTGVTSSSEALDLFRAEPGRFDLVITDMTLPKMTGIDLTRQILQIRPGMPVILCSGLRDPDTEEQVKSLGIRAYCTKPLTKIDLSRVIRDTLDGYE
jgi:PAS domain S-box-containing protein